MPPSEPAQTPASHSQPLTRNTASLDVLAVIQSSACRSAGSANTVTGLTMSIWVRTPMAPAYAASPAISAVMTSPVTTRVGAINPSAASGCDPVAGAVSAGITDVDAPAGTA